jgi:hypothetical protein
MKRAAGFYLQQQLNRIKDRRLIKVKFRDGSVDETHWLTITPEKFDRIREILEEDGGNA